MLKSVKTVFLEAPSLHIDRITDFNITLVCWVKCSHMEGGWPGGSIETFTVK